jgi:hypothetical protein
MKKLISNKPEVNPTIHERLRINSTDFAMEIENMVRRRRMGYIEAIIEYCEENDMDLDRAKEFIQGTLRGKIQAEAESLHLMPAVAKLPV